MPAYRFLWLLLAAGACAPAVPDDRSAAGSSAPDPSMTKADQPVLLSRPAPAGANYLASGGEGTLLLENGCFFFRLAERRFLLVWPDGTQWDAAGGSILFGEQRLRIGERVALAGVTGPAGPDFDARGCDATRVFRVTPWRADPLGEAPAPAAR